MGALRTSTLPELLAVGMGPALELAAFRIALSDVSLDADPAHLAMADHACSSPTTGTLFSIEHATTQALATRAAIVVDRHRPSGSR